MRSQSTPADYGQIKDIFSSASELAPEMRDAFLDEKCDNAETREEVESLLAAHDESESFLEDVSAIKVVQKSYQNSSNDKLIGQRIDEYRIVREIGRGGMGVVFLAERETFHQQVALKIIKRGMDSDAIVERFYRERQIMAALNHPFIASLLDGGTTTDGLPFFVMEYVDGVSIDAYCRDRSETEILQLFRKVCSAVSFAHQKLIVHRDLKPSNILINAEGEPKLLDFGIAKLLDATDANETNTQHRALTPAYASPEHIAGEIVGTASDVFSLGKVLSELLANSDGTNDGRSNRLAPDLQTVVSTAMNNDIERRYGSAERFADDIGRYLENLPVSARRDSLVYRTQKFIRRNRLTVAFTALLLFSLIAGLVATVWKANEASRERELAQKRFESLRRLSDSFVTEIHAAIQNLPGSLPARQLLLRRATEQLDALAEESGDNRALQDELAVAYFNLASLPDMSLVEKEATNKKGVAIYEKLLKDEPRNIKYREKLALAYLELADTVKVSGSVAKGFEYCRSAVEILDAVSAEQPNDVSHLLELREAVTDLGTYYDLKGDANESLSAFRRVNVIVGKMRALNLPSNDADRLTDLLHLQIGVSLTSLGEYKVAMTEIQTALNGFNTEHTREQNNTSINYLEWTANRRLAIATELDGDANKASVHAQKSLAIIEALMATSPKDIGYHRNSAVTHILLGQMLMRQNQAIAAIGHFRRALDLSREVLINDPEYFESKTDVARSLGNLGNALVVTRQYSEGSIDLFAASKMFDEMAAIDIDNAQLLRDNAETRVWIGSLLANQHDQRAKEFLRSGSELWNYLRSAGKLTAADIHRPDEAKRMLDVAL